MWILPKNYSSWIIWLALIQHPLKNHSKKIEQRNVMLLCCSKAVPVAGEKAIIFNIFVSLQGGRHSIPKQGDGTEPGLRDIFPTADGHEASGGDRLFLQPGVSTPRSSHWVLVHQRVGGAVPAAHRSFTAPLSNCPAILFCRALSTVSWGTTRKQVETKSWFMAK